MSHPFRPPQPRPAPKPSNTLLYMALLALLAGGTGCATTRAPMEASLPAMDFATEAASERPPPILTENHFLRDRAGSLSEEVLRQVRASPVFLKGEDPGGRRPGAGLVRAGGASQL